MHERKKNFRISKNHDILITINWLRSVLFNKTKKILNSNLNLIQI